LTNPSSRTSVANIMFRLLSSLFIAFLLFAVPALCMGGLSEHECDCGQGGAEEQCQHEASCSDDPCESFTVPKDQEMRSILDLEVSWVPVALFMWDVELDSTRWSRSWSPPPPPDWSNLPYAQSDRPLLI